MGEEKISQEIIQKFRAAIVLAAGKLEGIPYLKDKENPLRGKWTDLTKLPLGIDCSGVSEGSYRYAGLKLPHGSQNQFNFTVATIFPQPGDLVFMAHNRDITKVYHVGMFYDNQMIIESREFDPKASFPTGKVILRPRQRWEKFENFAGYRVHPKFLV